ncbi:hypothetical protein DPMN_162364 [Dreissena polymorpha]|uniref:BEN domain-containing protein n=1 Tax=Dreissena polymorpha TaxID=45954 RepID=A0A9D4EUQ9_DREPO|nr:hypothetical protein DPMN_162364 [Dreissena polymorpha]
MLNILFLSDNRGNLNKTLNAGFKIDMSRVQPDAQRKRHTSAPEEENKQGADEPHKKKRRYQSSDSDLQSTDPLVVQARQILLKRRSSVMSEQVTAQPEALATVTNMPVTPSASKLSTTYDVMPTALVSSSVEASAWNPVPAIPLQMTLLPATSLQDTSTHMTPLPATPLQMTSPPVTSTQNTPLPALPLQMTPQPATCTQMTPHALPVTSTQMTPLPATPTQLTSPPATPTMMTHTSVNFGHAACRQDFTSFDYGPAPPSVREVSFMEMMTGPLCEEEVETDTSECYVGSSCHSCCEQIKVMQTRITQMELMLKMQQSKHNIASCVTSPVVCASMPKPAMLQKDTLVASPVHTGNDQSLQSIIKAEIQHETREVKAIARAMCRLFTPHQLVTCSMKGAPTTTGSPRPSLPAAERNAIIEVIAKTFNRPLVDVEEKMRGCLRRLRLMYK